MEIQHSNHSSHEDLEIIIRLAQENNVNAKDLIEKGELLESLTVLHQTRRNMRERALSLVPDKDMEREMVEVEKRAAAERIKGAIQVHLKRKELENIANEELVA